MNAGDPPLHWDEAEDPPPDEFAPLLIWLRDTYYMRQYLQHGLPIPPEFGGGYSQGMVAACLKRRGFTRCDQPLINKMEKGKAWPGKTKHAEKEAFLYAAAECYNIKGTYLEDKLILALLMESGKRGIRQSLVDRVFQLLRPARGGPQ